MGGRKRGSSRFFPFPIFPRALTIFQLVLFLLRSPAVDLLQVDLLVSGASLFWPQAADRERRSRERSFLTLHMKSDEGLF